jgi:uncharacterized protein (TIGR00290 family)
LNEQGRAEIGVKGVKEKVILCFSGGKDSVLALYELLKHDDYEVAGFLTTITQGYGRIAMHGVRANLLELQTKSLGMRLEKVMIPKNSSDEEYESRMRAVLEKYVASEIHTIAFGDIFLEDIRKQRESNLSKMGMKAIFPLWKNNTAELAQEFIKLGFKAVITCIDGDIFDKTYAGKAFDKEFLCEIPCGTDPCGENGEFHSFVYDGPIFSERISHTVGKVVLREERFYYCDLTAVENCPGTMKQKTN